MAWGKPWPTGICTIDRDEILLNETDDSEAMDIDRAGNNLDDSDIPAKETFRYLLHVDLQVQVAFGLTPPILVQAILLLKEYLFLRELLERNERDSKVSALYHLVTGQPGTGSSNYTVRFCILSCLLLYGLEKKLPTAVQFSPTDYILFDAKGGSFRSTISRASERLPSGCWCLCDGNTCGEPLPAFYASRIVHMFRQIPRGLQNGNQADPTVVITAQWKWQL